MNFPFLSRSPVLRLFSFTLALASGLPSVQAADGLQLTGTARVRYESFSGQPRPAFKDGDQWISLRTTLMAQQDLGPLKFVGELYDSRVYLADRRSALSTNDVNALELTQAYVAADLGAVLGKGSDLVLQAGRFTLNVGSRRLVAADDFRNTTNAVTGLKSDFKFGSGYTGNVYYTLPQLRLPDALPSLLDNDIRWDRESSAAVLSGATLTSPRRFAGGALEGALVVFREYDAPGRPTRDRDLRTIDLRYFRDAKAGALDWEFETAWQTGHVRASTAGLAVRKAVDAGFVHARLGYQWNTRGKPRLGVDYDWVSGEGRGLQSQRFDTLFGMRRGDFAPSGLYNLVGRANISSPGLRFEVAPDARLDLMATVRGLWLASRTDAFSTIGIRDATGRAGDYAGTQFDTRVRYWLVPKTLRLEVNSVLLAKGRFLREAPNARNNGDARFVAVSLQTSF